MFWNRVLAVFFSVLIIAIIVGVPYLFLFGGADRFLLKPLQRRYEGLTLRDSPMEGDVGITYHTYRGLLIWFTQDEHIVFGPVDDVRLLLARLRNWNLTWGLLSYGALFIPLLAIVNYRRQMAWIEEQASRKTTWPVALGQSVKPGEVAVQQSEVLPTREPPSRFRKAVGWMIGFLCLLFTIGTIVSVATGEFDAVAGCAFVALLLGATARDWINN